MNSKQIISRMADSLTYKLSNNVLTKLKCKSEQTPKIFSVNVRVCIQNYLSTMAFAFWLTYGYKQPFFDKYYVEIVQHLYALKGSKIVFHEE